MTEISNPFSQFNTLHLSACNNANNMAKGSNNTVAQNQQKKAGFAYKDVFIPAGTSVIGGISGYIIAQFQEKDKLETLKQSALKLETALEEQLNKSKGIIQLNENIALAKKGIETAKTNLAEYQNDLLKTQKQSQIDIIKELIESANEMKNSNKAELDDCNKLLKSYYEHYVKTPLDTFVKSETTKIKNYKKKVILILTGVGLAIGAALIVAKKFFNKDKNAQ